ncbi:hypothetical protein L1887_32113 [Cichorium endivia]|nr:hypothetical protein L1887_32113 [Cichorium endivia]
MKTGRIRFKIRTRCETVEGNAFMVDDVKARGKVPRYGALDGDIRHLKEFLRDYVLSLVGVAVSYAILVEFFMIKVGGFVLLKVSPWKRVIRFRKQGSLALGTLDYIESSRKQALISGTKSIQVGENCKTRSAESRPGLIRGAALGRIWNREGLIRAARIRRICGAVRR